MSQLILITGGNIGEREKKLAEASKRISQRIGKVVRSSALYETAAWGNTQQADFLNQVLVVKTSKEPEEIMTLVLKIEKEMGRVRTEKNAPRVIDIDILFYDKKVCASKHLIIPHPQIQNRRFVLSPLNELIPQFKHPVLKKSVHQLLLSCKDPLAVKKRAVV